MVSSVASFSFCSFAREVNSESSYADVYVLFSKPLLKLTKNRIEVIKRKRRATEKFLKKDVADLLHSGLDINAYGRVIPFERCLILYNVM